jgi:hypothetical protein
MNGAAKTPDPPTPVLDEDWERCFADQVVGPPETARAPGGAVPAGARRLLRRRPSLLAEVCCVFGRAEGLRQYPRLAREAAEVVEEPGCVLGVVRGRTEDSDLLLLGAWVGPDDGYVDAEALAWFPDGARREVLPLAGMALPYEDGEVAECRVLPVIMDLSPRYRERVLAEGARVAASVTLSVPAPAAVPVPGPER